MWPMRSRMREVSSGAASSQPTRRPVAASPLEIPSTVISHGATSGTSAAGWSCLRARRTPASRRPGRTAGRAGGAPPRRAACSRPRPRRRSPGGCSAVMTVPAGLSGVLSAMSCAVRAGAARSARASAGSRPRRASGGRSPLRLGERRRSGCCSTTAPGRRRRRPDSRRTGTRAYRSGREPLAISVDSIG